jgi:hypothetical protein
VRTVFLVPRRRDGGPRDAIWKYCRARWEQYFPDVEIFEGHHDDGPFNRSAAVNRAAEEAGTWDLGIVIDSDVILSVDQVRKAIEKASRTGHVTWAHRRWRGVTESWTNRIVADRQDFGPQLDRDAIDLIVDRTNPLSWSCCIVIPRAVFDDMGGFDERFRGWGFEDMAFQSVVCGLYGYERINGDVIHLWHPRSEERITPGKPRLTATPDYVTNARLGRRYMVALRRDYALHDRGDQPASEEERQRDIRNLVADDQKYEATVAALRLPDWSQWWPTLEELRDGAKAARGQGSVPPLTIAVRTGGAAEAWPVRSEYLRRSLASLTENVTGNVIQRVIYSDWDSEFTEQLQAIADEQGFYVVGGGHHGYTESVRRLWQYLQKRARGRYIFLAEDDFLYLRPVVLDPMVETLQRNGNLRQIALLRGPAYPREFENGGILGWPEDSFTRQGDRLEHRNFWTMNPSVFDVAVTETPWPKQASSERVFGDVLLRDQDARFAFWGAGEPWLEHIGEVRAGGPY